MRTIDLSSYISTLPRNPTCTACPLHQTVNHNVCVPTAKVSYSLSTGTPLVILGQNPGYYEDAICLPFVGKSGELLHDGYIKPAKLHESFSIYISNAVRCFTPMNALPPAKSIKACFPLYTIPDLKSIIPENGTAYILCLGAPASSALFKQLFNIKVNQKEAFTFNGRSYQWQGRQLVVFSTFHPAFILRVPNAKEEVALHLTALQRHAAGLAPIVSTPTVVPSFAPPST